jgi:hypothetical protein
MNVSTASTAPRTTRPARSPRRRQAALAAAGLIAIAGFEIALALGAPLGHAAWGGAHAHLAVGLRIASGFSAGLWVLGALVVLRRGGYGMSPISPRLSRYGTWALVGLLTVGALMNFASPSNWERFLQAPIALLLALLCLIVARGGPVSITTTCRDDKRQAR